MEKILFEYKKNKKGEWKETKTGEPIPSELIPDEDVDSIIVLDTQAEHEEEPCEDCDEEKEEEEEEEEQEEEEEEEEPETQESKIPEITSEIYWEGDVPLSLSNKIKYKIDKKYTVIYKNPQQKIMGKELFCKFFYDADTKDIYFWHDGNRSHHHEVWKTKLNELYPDDPDKYKAVLKKGSIMLKSREKEYSIQVFEEQDAARKTNIRDPKLELDSYNRLVGEFYLNEQELKEIENHLQEENKKYKDPKKKKGG